MFCEFCCITLLVQTRRPGDAWVAACDATFAQGMASKGAGSKRAVVHASSGHAHCLHVRRVPGYSAACQQ